MTITIGSPHVLQFVYVFLLRNLATVRVVAES